MQKVQEEAGALAMRKLPFGVTALYYLCGWLPAIWMTHTFDPWFVLVHGALWCTDYTALGCLDENYGGMMCDFSKW